MSALLTADEIARLRNLVHSTPWAALATSDVQGPYAAMVAVAWHASQSCAYLHLSRLALHTRQLLARPSACLVLSESAVGIADPQTLLRVTVRIEATTIAREDPNFAAARDVYCQRLPASAQLFGFGDFVLFRAVPVDVRVVFGFARALSITPAAWFETIGT